MTTNNLFLLILGLVGALLVLTLIEGIWQTVAHLSH
jgi:hypothetical protein